MGERTQVISEKTKRCVQEADPNGMRCLIENCPQARAVEFCYVVPNSLREERQTMDSLEWSWNMRNGTLDLSSSRNIFLAGSSFRVLHDENRWALLPPQKIVSKYMASLIRVGSQKVTKRETFPDIPNGVYNYRFLPLSDVEDITITRQTEFPPTPNSFITYIHPFDTLPFLRCHIHPKFAILELGRKLSAMSPEVLRGHVDSSPLLDDIFVLFRAWTSRIPLDAWDNPSYNTSGGDVENRSTSANDTEQIAVPTQPPALRKSRKRPAPADLSPAPPASRIRLSTIECNAEPPILNRLHKSRHTEDNTVQALLHIIDVLYVSAPRHLVLSSTSPRLNPIPSLMRIAEESTERTMIIASLSALTSVFANPANAAHLAANSPALRNSIRYLPLVIDKPILDACLNYLYCHISHPAMAKAFLLRPEMPKVLRLLSNLFLQGRKALAKVVTVDRSGPVYAASELQATCDYELTQEELNDLSTKPEPQRCHDWMKAMFASTVDGELTQVEFYSMYKTTFASYTDPHPLLTASNMLNDLTTVFPQALAIVLRGPPKRYIVHGIERRKVSTANERYRCKWNRGQCPAQPFSTSAKLFDHLLLEHLAPIYSNAFPCLWASCSRPPCTKQALTLHILTHLPSVQPAQLQARPPDESDTVIPPAENSFALTECPTSQPPPRSASSPYQAPLIDPATTSLTALLILRILFRTSFAPVDDAAHCVESSNGIEDQKGEQRGQKAFAAVRGLLKDVEIGDEALMGWISEMADKVQEQQLVT